MFVIHEYLVDNKRGWFIGTTERVCLITGNVEAIMAVMDFIMDKIREKPDLTTKTTVDFDSGKATAERDKQVIFHSITQVCTSCCMQFLKSTKSRLRGKS